jgi:integrase/recombinase XerD
MQFIDDELLSPLSSGTIEEDISFWITQFIENKELEKVAPKTIKSYEQALESFKDFVVLHKDNNTMENIGAKFINRYLIEYQALLASTRYQEDKLSKEDYETVTRQADKKFLGKNDALFEILKEFENTLTHRVAVIKMLLKFISENNSNEQDYEVIFHQIAKIKIKEKFTEYLTINDIDEVIDFMTIWINVWKQYKPKSSERYAYRESLLMLLYALTGARSEEVVKIKLRDIEEFSHRNKSYYRIKIQEGKGGNIREIAIEADFIRGHIDYLKQELPDDSYYLSSTYSNGTYLNKPHHQDNIRKFGNFALKTLGINKSGLHTFRRGFATKKVVHDGVEISTVAKMMGNTTNVLEKYYLKHNAEMNIKQ